MTMERLTKRFRWYLENGTAMPCRPLPENVKPGAAPPLLRETRLTHRGELTMFARKPPVPAWRNSNGRGWLARPVPFVPPTQRRRTRLPQLAAELLEIEACEQADTAGVPEQFLI